MWLTVAIIGYLLLSSVSILDKFILSNRSMKPIVFVFYSSIFLLPLALLLPFGVNWLNGGDWWTAIISGMVFCLAMWAFYIAFAKSEVSHVGPLVGAAVPIFTLILNQFFLKEIFTGAQLYAMIFLIVGCLLISFEKSRAHNGWHSGFLWGILAGLLFAISHVTAKLIYIDYGFYTGFVWTRLFIAIPGVLLLFWPMVRKSLFVKKIKTKEKFSSNVVLVSINKILAVVGVLLVQYAIASGSVSVVNALGGIQFGMVVILVAFLSYFFPKLFKEEYCVGEIVQEILAVALIGFGLYLLV
jgi:drug/metabolite transporter (DMT)-like permease